MAEFVGNEQIPLEQLPPEVSEIMHGDSGAPEAATAFGDVALEELADELLPSYEDEKGRYTSIHVSEDLVGDYMKQIIKTPLLKAAEEVELSKAIEAGLFAAHKLQTDDNLEPAYAAELAQLALAGEAARTLMIQSNLRLVVSVAKRYVSRKGGGMEFSELIQEGNFGLNRAVEKFDYKKGFKFSTYATWWIRQSITRSMADQARAIRLPVHIVEIVNKIRRVSENIERTGQEATDEAIAHELDISNEKVRELRMISRDPVSLQSPVNDGDRASDDTMLGDLLEDDHALAPEDLVELSSLQNIVLDSLKFSLRDREQLILRHRYGLNGQPPATLEQIGQILGITRERVRQIETKAMEKLQRNEKLGQLAHDYAFKKTN